MSEAEALSGREKPAGSPAVPGGRVVARHPLTISTTLRWLLGTLGLGLLAVASWAVLREDNELGTVALALIGATFLIIAGLGRWPSKLTWGDKQAEWLEEVLETTVSEGSPETRQEVLDIAGRRISTTDDLVFFNLLQSRVRRTAPSAAIHQLSRLVPADAVLSADAAGAGRRVDAQIARKGERGKAKAVAVELLSPEQDAPGPSLRAALDLLEQGFGAVLLVSSAPERLIFPSAGDRSAYDRIFVTSLTSPTVEGDIQRALNSVATA